MPGRGENRQSKTQFCDTVSGTNDLSAKDRGTEGSAQERNAGGAKIQEAPKVTNSL